MPGHRSHYLLALTLVVSALGAADPAAAQARYVSEDAVGIGAMGEYGTHLGPRMTTALLLAQPRGRFLVGFMAGTGRVETIPGPTGFSGEEPRETVYGPRAAVRITRLSTEKAPQILVTGGWEWQEITHPDIEAAEGELKTSGPVFGLAFYQLMDRTDSRDLFFDASIERYNLPVHVTNADQYMEIFDPIITYQAGLTCAFKGGRARPRSTLVRTFARVTEWDLTFGIGVGLMWETASPY